MRKAYIWGGVFGIVAPFLGVFLGLQVLPLLGSILAFPFVILTMVTGIPFGNFGTPLKLLAFLISVASWSTVFGVAAKVLKR